MSSENTVTNYVCPNGLTHSGTIIDEKDGFSALACDDCGFVHAVPIPTSDELAEFYRAKFYESDRKIDYFEAQAAQRDWWHKLFSERLSAFEKHLGHKGRILDLGCGPGFFLAYAKEQGWEVLGVEPSEKASAFAEKELGIKVLRCGFENIDAETVGSFDVVYSHGVIEHLQNPLEFMELTKALLKDQGLVFVNCANDFNPFQKALRETQDYPCWWFVPPEHLNYFTVKTLRKLVEKTGFKVEDSKTSFPLDMFLLMGDNYVANPAIGKECHSRRVAFESALEKAGMSDLTDKLYRAFADLDIGRQIDLIARKG